MLYLKLLRVGDSSRLSMNFYKHVNKNVFVESVYAIIILIFNVI